MDILIIDDDEAIRKGTRMSVEMEGHYAEAVETAEAARLSFKEAQFDLIFLDLHLGENCGLVLLEEFLTAKPDQLVIMFTAFASVETAVKATRMGAFDYLSKPFKPDQVRASLVRSQKELATQSKITTLENTVTELQSKVSTQSVPTRFESTDPTMQKVLETLMRSAKTPASILLLGESGTGKSVIAQTVHENSHLAHQPFVTVSCPSLSKELLESELFGHTKGSFTGAIKDQWGKVHAANGGTLFLDEIGELPMEIQPKLLRLLQEKQYERLGENKTREANVRIIAATNQDLSKAIQEGRFREDLFYRINVISVELPPLRKRLGDLITFATDYLEYFSRQIGMNEKTFSKNALITLRSHPWPGNLRELRNSIERATILSSGNEIQAQDLPISSHMPPAINEKLNLGDLVPLAEIENEHIDRVIDRIKSVPKAAQILGVDKTTLYRKRKRLAAQNPSSS